MRTSIAINHIRQRVYVRCAVCTMCVCWESGAHFNLLGVFHIFIPFYFRLFVIVFVSYFLDMAILLFSDVVVVVLFPSIQSLFKFLLILFSCSAHLCFTRSLLLLFQLLFICMISPKVIFDLKTSVSTFCYLNATHITQAYINSLHFLTTITGMSKKAFKMPHHHWNRRSLVTLFLFQLQSRNECHVMSCHTGQISIYRLIYGTSSFPFLSFMFIILIWLKWGRVLCSMSSGFYSIFRYCL